MNVKITKSKVEGTITIPPSKSITHRAIIIASLASGKSVIKNMLLSDDTKCTIEALRSLGVEIEQNGNTLTIHGSKGKLIAPKTPISVGNSGSTMRMLSAVAALAKGKTVLTGEKRLLDRPMGDLLNALKSVGIRSNSIENNNCPPIAIAGGTINGGTVHVRGDVSSQYISALLLIAPFAENSMTIVVDGKLRSKPYIALTIAVMKTFGVEVKNNNFQTFTVQKGQTYKSKEYIVEGDYSSASYFFAAAAITGGKVAIEGLNPNSAQGDKFFLDLIERMGCDVSLHSNKISVKGNQNLNSIEVDMGDYPDIVQTLAAVAANARGKTMITNIEHLKHKESDRIETTLSELKKMGIDCSFDSNSLNITGGKPKGAVINTHNDHRVAMSFTVAALGGKGETIIQNAEVVNKSYPDFFNDLKKLGAKVIS